MNRFKLKINLFIYFYSQIAFGTQDGVVSFLDIRRNDQPLPVAFKVSQDPINEV
jgi:hypothetical protein